MSISHGNKYCMKDLVAKITTVIPENYVGLSALRSGLANYCMTSGKCY
jgi:hypothetical protein